MSVHPFLTEGRHDVLAHRGASAEEPPGNSSAAFQRALDLGADHLETDVQCTSDGVVVIYHDDTLDEASTARGRIADHTWDDLASARLVADGTPTDEGLLRLDEALATWPDAFWNIDVKTDDAVDAAIALLRERARPDRTCLASFSRSRLSDVSAALGPDWCRSAAGTEMPIVRLASWLRLPVPSIVDVVQVPRSWNGVRIVDRRLVDACHDRGIAVHVWTINDADEMHELFDLGVDAIVTDDPATALGISPSPA